MKIKAFILLALLSLPGLTWAQFSTFRNPVVAPLLFNPGFAGMTDQQRISIAYRNEYPGFGVPTYLLYGSYDQLSHRLKGAIGGEVSHERLGSNSLFRASAIYSPKLNLGANWTFSPALKVGYRGIGFDVVTIGTNPPSLVRLLHHGLNLSPGLLLNSSNFYVGLASDYLVNATLKEETAGTEYSFRPIRNWKLQSGYRFLPRPNSVWSLSATGLFVTDQFSSLLNGQLIFKYRWLILGGGANGTVAGTNTTGEAVNFNAGIKLDRFRLIGGYSRALNRLGTSPSPDAFEISLMVYFKRKQQGPSASSINEI